MRYLLLGLALLLFIDSKSQFYNYDYTYQDNIASVNVTVNDQITSVPSLRLNGNDYMIATFDDLYNSEDDFYYRIVHCDRNWNKSEIYEIDYLEGFNNEVLRVWEFSQLTSVEYTHFWIQIPNRDVQLKISGNYLLYVYQLDEDEKEIPILSRRFVVFEENGTISMELTRTSDASLDRFYHQFDVNASIPSSVENPMVDISLDVIQNGMWTDAVTNRKPFSVLSNGVRFDPFGSILFPGLREFRSFDTRILRGGGTSVESMRLAYDVNEAVLYKDFNLSRTPYLLKFDFNGKYFVDALDAFRVTNSNEASRDQIDFSERAAFSYNRRFLDGEYTYLSKDIKADYIDVHFELESPYIEKDVYVYGALSDWQLNPRFKMEYDNGSQSYKAVIRLKQGFYDYMYALDTPEGIDLKFFQGSWYNTEHVYTSILYYREFGTRYDRVLAVNRFNSFRDL